VDKILVQAAIGTERRMLMHYVMSDIHGCYFEYLNALEYTGFNNKDTLYILGDCVDRGLEPVRLLQDMMSRPNIVPLMGNHDLEALVILDGLFMKHNNVEKDTGMDFTEMAPGWLADGGKSTMKEFLNLSYRSKQDVLKYLSGFSLYKEIEVNGRRYLMVHGGLEPFSPDKKIEDYDLTDLLLARPDYEKVYFKDKYTITGHTPTILSQKGNKGTIIHKNNHIAIDCGCVFGYNLAVLCLETGREYYIPYNKYKQQC